MKIAKVVKDEDGQAIILPEGFEIGSKTMKVKRVGDAVLLIPEDDSFESFLKGLSMFSTDFTLDDRGVQSIQNRETL